MTLSRITPTADATAIRSTVAAVTENRELGKVQFNTAAISSGGISTKCVAGPLTQAGVPDRSRIGKFEWSVDEPTSLLGTDNAPSPAEYILSGLAGCYTVTLTQLATLRGIELSRIDLDLDFDIDLSGFLGIDDTVRKGAQGINVKMILDSPNASETQLQELVAELEATSPIRDTLANAVAVTTTLQTAPDAKLLESDQTSS